MPGDNFFEFLDARFVALGEKPALRSPAGEILLSYADLRAGAARYANALAMLGVVPGDRVSVQTAKSLECVMLYLGVVKAGAVYHPLNPGYTADEVAYFLGDAEPQVVVCDPARQAETRRSADSFRISAVLNLDAKGQGSMADFARRMDARHTTVARGPDDLAGLLYTSGTTGRSKGAMISHGNIASNAKALVKLWAMTAEDRLIHALPVYHVHGLFVALHTAFLAGAQLLWFENFDRDGVLSALPHATMLMGVPTFYTRLLNSERLTPDLCAAMRLFISGSAPLLAETHRSFAARTGHVILERYGMTETGMIASNPYHGARVPGTVGFALPGVEVRIGGDPGVIEVKGPNVFKGYWHRPEMTREEFRADGFFITGDTGSIDPDGRITISGRAKDLIISGGFNVYPTEIEERIEAIPGIAEAAVIGVPHPDFGEAVVAAVTASAPLPPEAEMIGMLAERLAKFKLPKRIFVVDALPRNAMGKVQKAELRARYASTFTPA